MLQALKLWFDDGGELTFAEYLALSAEDKKEVVRFLAKLPLFAEVSANCKDYVLVHSGFHQFSLSRSLKSYTAEETLFRRLDLEIPLFEDKAVIVGHTPTFFYGEDDTGKILSRKNLINVDCGCVYPQSGVLGCLRLEDLKEFYIR